VGDATRRVRVSTIVSANPAESFDVFTRETALWWRRGTRSPFSSTAPGILRFEPDGVGRGRVLEEWLGRESVEVGTILVWQPGARLVFEWWSSRVNPSVHTEVEVRFARVESGTEVVLEHRGWSRDRDGQALRDWLGLWWADLFTTYRFHLRRRPESARS
jgi:Activator of Hsp90 ATPase homolog 1-like protein